MLLKRNEMDRPTYNTLRYLTTVKPHLIRRDPFLIDEYARQSLFELLGEDPVEEFGRYTRSFYTLEGHYQNLWLYDRTVVSKPIDPVLELAISHVRALYRLPNPVFSHRWNDLRSVPFISSSSAGWGYVGKKGDIGNHDIAVRRAVGSLYAWLRPGRLGPFRYHPDLAWTRTQLATPDSPKIRHVWGAAFENVILEGITAAPLIEAYRRICFPMVIGTHLYRRLPLIINQTLNPPEEDSNIGVGLDLKSFDSSVQPWLIHEAFDILKSNIIFSGYMEEASFEFSRHYFIHRPVVMPDGRMWLKHVGVPSGSYFTQMIDSIVNSIVIAYAQLKIYGRTFRTYVLGDDSLFGIPRHYGYPNLEDFSYHLTQLGFTLSTHKCVIATRPDELEFLGHCARGSRLTRDSAELLRLALYPEYPVLGPADSMSRMSGLLLDTTLTNWPILHLYRYMMNKYRHIFQKDDPLFSRGDKDWLVAVVGLELKPTMLNEIKVFTIT